jgi:hypothetical protein
MASDTSVPLDTSVYAPPKATEPPQPVPGRRRPPAFFATSPLKLVVMSTVTFGFYGLFWFYANWQRLKRRGHPRISPFWRTFFALFFSYALFRTVKKTADDEKIVARFSPGLLALGWTFANLLVLFPKVGWFLSYGSVFLLVPIQKTMNDINRALYPDHDPNTRFTAWNIVGIVLGGLLLAAALWGTLETIQPG